MRVNQCQKEYILCFLDLWCYGLLFLVIILSLFYVNLCTFRLPSCLCPLLYVFRCVSPCPLSPFSVFEIHGSLLLTFITPPRGCSAGGEHVIY